MGHIKTSNIKPSTEEMISFLLSKGMIPYTVWKVDMPILSLKNPHLHHGDDRNDFECSYSEQMTIEEAYHKMITT